MRIKVATSFLLCFLFINGCSYVGNRYNTFLVANSNKEYTTNCIEEFIFMSVYFVVPFPFRGIDSCDIIYLKEDKFSILYNGELYIPIQREKEYIIKIDINELKKSKTAKIIHEDNKIEFFRFYELHESFYGYSDFSRVDYSRVFLSKKKFLTSE